MHARRRAIAAAPGVLTVRQRQPDLALADVYAPEMSDELINAQPNPDRELDLLLQPGVAAAPTLNTRRFRCPDTRRCPLWAVRDADTVVPPPKSCLATSDPSGYSDPVPLRVHQDASDARSSCAILRQCAIGTCHRACGHVPDASAPAPWEPPGRPLNGAAGAPLRGGDPGHHGVDVHAAPAPGGFSAAATTGGTTHKGAPLVFVSYWMTLLNIPHGV